MHNHYVRQSGFFTIYLENDYKFVTFFQGNDKNSLWNLLNLINNYSSGKRIISVTMYEFPPILIKLKGNE